MTISLSKGGKISLDKVAPGLTKAIIGLGWDTNKYCGGFDFDLDASAFMLNAQGKARKESDFIFYNNLRGEDDCVIHTGDNRTGDGDGDDEQIIIDFTKIPRDVEAIAITVTIHDAVKRNQNFGQVSNAYVRLLNQETEEEILKYDLGEDFSIETALVFCRLYRHNGEWKFDAVGSGYQGGLASLCSDYGLDAE